MMRRLRRGVGASFWMTLAAAALVMAGPAALEEATLKVEGMTCGGCAAGLQAMLAAVDGVAEARVDYEAGRAYLRYDPAAIEPAELASAISRDGITATFLPGEAAPAAPGSASGPGCAGPAPAAATASAPGLDAAGMDRAADWVLDRLLGTVDASGAISRDDIEAGTGVAISDADLPAFRAHVIRRLQEEHPAAFARLTAGTRCAKYGACSLQGNLAGASGETLQMYEREKKEDGRTYADFALPEFEARDLAGRVVRSADLVGRPTVVVLLAGHCNHCHDSLPILQEAVETWGPRGVRVVGIVVNSGSVKDVNEWLPLTHPTYDVWVYNDESLGDLLGSHLVPSYFFVDAGGRITEKLVGFQEKSVVLERLTALVRGGEGADEAQAALGAR